MNAIEKVKKFQIINTPLLELPKQVDDEVQEYKDKLKDYGIRNSTVRKIEKGLKKLENDKEEVGKKEAINILVTAFAPFAIVTYKTLDQVCTDHKLVIAKMGAYDKAIPDENIEDIDCFINKLKGIDESTLNRIRVNKNSYFSFDNDRNAWESFLGGQYDTPIGTDQMFKVAAPRGHFKLSKSDTRIGNEYSHVDKPSFHLDLKINQPLPPLDPIVFVPIKFVSQVFCIIVTAWDKVADDSRILSKL